MKFKSEIAAADQEDLERDFQNALDLGNARLGESWLFFSKIFSTEYLPYDQVARAWLRLEEVNVLMGCRTVFADQYSLMVEDRDGNLHQATIKNRALGEEGLSLISQRRPAAQAGCQKPIQG